MTRPEFSDATLIGLLRALRTRSATHPESPGLIASTPAVREDRMAAACAELRSRGHAVTANAVPGGTSVSWSIGAAAEHPRWG
jgi:hypothetical protein